MSIPTGENRNFIKRLVGIYADEKEYSMSFLGLERQISGYIGVPMSLHAEFCYTWSLIEIVTRPISIDNLKKDVQDTKKYFSAHKIFINNLPSLQNQINLRNGGVDFIPANEIVMFKGLLNDKTLIIDEKLIKRFETFLNSYSLECQNSQINSILVACAKIELKRSEIGVGQNPIQGIG
ncbi:hypothetical protein F7734_55755 [Scytonema sp. UIC 10036]|uniref:hypothetical protein n=1 Tax=Scytonema sp. UIC 10036 TaxID=2304196 RepID=UPI0012DA1A95|nr:hypothetical protein [Scytonema sp. UIC 10036]MUH01036.1 hypothetical protein [Scytonema sp. UIC 10036]